MDESPEKDGRPSPLLVVACREDDGARSAEEAAPPGCGKECHAKGTFDDDDDRRGAKKASTIRQHYYPEGGWGWLVCGCVFLVHMLTTGLQLSYGVLCVEVVRHFGGDTIVQAAWLGSLSYSLAFFVAPLVVAFCRRKSVRLTAVFGGLVAALGCLFTSFASQFHQVMLSYGVFVGVGVGMTRETANLMIGQYFKRKRDLVEIIVQMGSGAGIAVMSVVIRESVRSLRWRLGLQSVTLVVFVTFILGVFYRPASLYHPQRRAILHLKNQRRKVRDKTVVVERASLFELGLLGTKTLQIIMISTAICSLGSTTPLFYTVYIVEREGLDNASVLLLQVYLGLGFVVGCGAFGFLVVKRSAQCMIAKQNLCQAAMLGVGVAILSFCAVEGFRGYVLFAWLYGTFFGGMHYVLKVLVFERIRTKHFGRAWAYVEWASSISLLLGIPAAGYINQSHGPKAGFYYGCACAIAGSLTLSLLTCRRRCEPDPPPADTKGDLVLAFPAECPACGGRPHTAQPTQSEEKRPEIVKCTSAAEDGHLLLDEWAACTHELCPHRRTAMLKEILVDQRQGVGADGTCAFTSRSGGEPNGRDDQRWQQNHHSTNKCRPAMSVIEEVTTSTV